MVVRARDGEAMRETLIAVGLAVADERGLAAMGVNSVTEAAGGVGPRSF